VNPGPDGRAYPATAQHAVREGKHVARNIARVLDGKPTKPMAYRTVGTTAAIGCRTAVAEVFGIKVSGFPAWFLWRTLYLFKMPGMARRARLAADWTLDLLFKREFVQLGIHRATKGAAGTE
jgi:NADH dehydrogenase